MKLKKCTAIAIGIAALLNTAAFADDAVKVTLNSTEISFENAKPAIVNGRTLVPLRGIFDKMGYTIEYDNNTKTATLTNGNKIIKASSAELSADGVSLSADVLPQLIDGYFMVPLRAISEATGAEVSWNQNTKTADISSTTNGVIPLEAEIPDNPALANPKGTMPVDEEEYIRTLNNTVAAIKNTAVSKRCVPIMVVFGIESNAQLADNYSDADLKWLDDYISAINAMNPPESLKTVQSDVTAYTTVLTKASLYCKDNNLDRSDLMSKLQTLNDERAELNANFSVDLYQYFTDNNVFFESVYGEEILDMLS